MLVRGVLRSEKLEREGWVRVENRVRGKEREACVRGGRAARTASFSKPRAEAFASSQAEAWACEGARAPRALAQDKHLPPAAIRRRRPFGGGVRGVRARPARSLPFSLAEGDAATHSLLSLR